MKLRWEENRTAAMVSWLIQGRGKRLVTALNNCFITANTDKVDADKLRHDFVELINQNLKSFTKYADSNCDGAANFNYRLHDGIHDVANETFFGKEVPSKLIESQKSSIDFISRQIESKRARCYGSVLFAVTMMSC
eukprot:GHVU01176389.1.p1 GENE.GHVU01176389.1~~GHVU01176389.1.p1  ORF type:complete len:136 (+),score=9.41 GHVU01176389.1:627-1034(+)